MSGFVPLNAGYTVSVRGTRLNVVVLLTLELARESPTCILHEGIYTPYHARSKYHTQLAKMSLDCKKTFWSISQLAFFLFFSYELLLVSHRARTKAFKNVKALYATGQVARASPHEAIASHLCRMFGIWRPCRLCVTRA